MSWASVDLEGFKELQRNLKGLQGFIDSDNVVDGLHDGIKVISRIAKNRAPRGPTGNLRRAIRTGKFRKQIRKNPAVFMGIDYRIGPHAHLVEFGVKNIRYPTRRKVMVIGGERGELGGLKGFLAAFRGQSYARYSGDVKFVKWAGPIKKQPFWRPSIDVGKSAAGIIAAKKIAFEIERAAARKQLQRYARWI